MKYCIEQEVTYDLMVLSPDIAYSFSKGTFNEEYRSMKMSVIYPQLLRRGNKKMPAVVFICGGGGAQMNRNMYLPQLMRLAQRGFIIASPEYHLMQEAPFPVWLQDIKAAIRFLRARAEEFQIDPDRIYIMGESSGAASAALCSATNGVKKYDVGDDLEYSSDVKGAVVLYGIYDMTKLKGTIDDSLLASFGDLKECSAFYQATEATPPTLLFHGTEDEGVPTDQSEAYYSRLQELGVRSDYYLVEKGNHSGERFYEDKLVDIMAEFLNSCR